MFTPTSRIKEIVPLLKKLEQKKGCAIEKKGEHPAPQREHPAPQRNYASYK